MYDTGEHGSVTDWLTTISDAHGEADTAWRSLWERYAPVMQALARPYVGDGRKPLADDEDSVVEAFRDLFQGNQDGRFAQRTDRDDLQQILITITQRRAIDAARRNEFRTVHEAGESALPLGVGGAGTPQGMDHLPGPDNPPELPLLAREELTRLLDALQSDQLRQVALMRVLCATNEEIAAALGVGVRSVQFKIQLIAQRWQKISGGTSLG